MTPRLRHALLVACAVVGLMAGCASQAPTSTPSPPFSVAPAAPAASPAPAPPAEKINDSTEALFAPASAALSPAAMENLADLACRMHGVKLEVLVAVGHADGRETSSDAALKLSTDRAEAVKAYMARLGVNHSRIYTEGKGRTQPVADNNTAANRSKNRRVDVEVIGTRDSAAGPSEPQARCLVSVLFGTNRAKTGQNQNNPGNYFSSREAEGSNGNRLTLGRVTVRVPPSRRMGELKEPGLFWVALEKITRIVENDGTLVHKLSAGNPNTDFSFEGSLEEYTEQDFASTLNAYIKKSKTKSALVYVHGLKNSFKDAAFRTAQFAYDLADEQYDVVPVLFSWPSDPAKVNYVAASDRAWSAGRELAVFLEKLSTTTGAGVIHIVAHSKGAQVLGFALDTLRTSKLFAMGKDGKSLVPRFREIILAAPDIRASDFRSIILPAVASHHSVSNYVSSNDYWLRLSKKINAGARAGDSGGGAVLTKGVETIDVTVVNYEPYGHSTFAESPQVIADIRQQLQGIKPMERKLQPHPMQKAGNYWLLNEKEKPRLEKGSSPTPSR